MGLTYTLRPISDRSAFTGEHKNSPFTVSWSDAFKLLHHEYDALGGRKLVLEVDVREQDIRLDGTLRANAKSPSPAVRVAFESKHGPITMATDRFIRPSWRREGMVEDWQHNVYAIAKSLEALRLVDRYGVTKRGEQYTGWKALPGGTGAIASGMTTDLAIEVLIREAGAAAYDDLADVLRSARGNAHPDRNHGDRARWNAVDEAEQVLRRAGRL